MTRRILPGIAVVAVFVLGLVVPDALAGSQQPSCESEELERFDRSGTAPVLFVHGWTGNPSTWRQPISRAIDEDITPHGRSLAEQVARFDQADGWLLDYNAESARWVSDPSGGGPRVAAAIDCLYTMYGKPVTVIAHSMGGLATRWAAARDGRSAAMASVVTFGTPHTGSDHAAVMAAAIGLSNEWSLVNALNPALELLIRECGIATGVHVDACAPLPTFVSAFDSPAGRALRTGSEELRSLADWPSGLPVLSLGAEIEIVTQSGGLFYQDVATYHAGDGIVSSASASAAGTEQIVRTCRHNVKLGYAPSDDLGELFRVHYDDNDERSIQGLRDTPCWHGKLMTGVELTNDAVGFIGEHLPDSGTSPDRETTEDFGTIVSDGAAQGPDESATCAAREVVLNDVGQIQSVIAMTEDTRFLVLGQYEPAATFLLDTFNDQRWLIDDRVNLGSTRDDYPHLSVSDWAMSQDGRYLVFATRALEIGTSGQRRAEPEPANRTSVYLFDRESGETVRLSAGREFQATVDISRDGKWIVIATADATLPGATDDEEDSVDAFVYSVEDRSYRRLTDSAGSGFLDVTISATGSYVALGSPDSGILGDRNVHVLSREGGRSMTIPDSESAGGLTIGWAKGNIIFQGDYEGARGYVRSFDPESGVVNEVDFPSRAAAQLAVNRSSGTDYFPMPESGLTAGLCTAQIQRDLSVSLDATILLLANRPVGASSGSDAGDATPSFPNEHTCIGQPLRGWIETENHEVALCGEPSNSWLSIVTYSDDRSFGEGVEVPVCARDDYLWEGTTGSVSYEFDLWVDGIPSLLVTTEDSSNRHEALPLDDGTRRYKYILGPDGIYCGG